LLLFGTAAERVLNEACAPVSLQAIPMERRVEMQGHVLRLRLRWTYHSVDRLELQRQAGVNRTLLDPWLQAVEQIYSLADDAMSTLFQVRRRRVDGSFFSPG